MDLRDPAPGTPWAPQQYWVCPACGRHFWTTYASPNPKAAEEKPAAKPAAPAAAKPAAPAAAARPPAATAPREAAPAAPEAAAPPVPAAKPAAGPPAPEAPPAQS
jgi:hypothetical protein